MYPVPPRAEWAGRTEEICGKWLAGPAARLGHRRDQGRPGPAAGLVPAGPVRQRQHGALDRWHHVERGDGRRACGKLGTDYIDLYQTHWPDPNVPIEETLEALDRAVESGKIRYVGCSNQSAYGLAKSLWMSELQRPRPRLEPGPR